jgi:hypothetical protein
MKPKPALTILVLNGEIFANFCIGNGKWGNRSERRAPNPRGVNFGQRPGIGVISEISLTKTEDIKL